MADVTDVPGPPVTLADEFVLIGAQGDEGSPRGAGAGAHHELLGSRHGDGSAATPGVQCRVRAVGLRTLTEGGGLARIELWNGDICDLEVDAS